MDRGAAMALRVVALSTALVLLAGCASTWPSPTVTICDGIGVEMGGCADDLPSFTGKDCDAVAREWGRLVEAGVVAIVSGPEAVDGEARSVRLKQLVVLMSVLAGRHLDDIGVREQCEAERFLGVAEKEFSDEVRDQVGSAMFDGEPVVPYQEWRADVARTVRSIEDE